MNMPRNPNTVLVARKGKYVAIAREVYEYNLRKKLERKAAKWSAGSKTK